MIEIRSAEADDLLFLEEAEGNIFSDPWNKSALEAHLSSPFGKSLILLDENEKKGYLLGNAILDEGEIFRIAVLPEYRKEGLGFLLLTHFELAVGKEGVTRLFLEVRKENESAKKLYEKKGFLLTGVRKGYYKNPPDDALLYEKITDTKE